MEQYERQLDELFEMVGSETRTCVVSTYGSLAFNHIAARDEAIRGQIGRHGRFWFGLQAAQQVSAFIALERLYDDDGDTWRLQRLIDFAEQY